MDPLNIAQLFTSHFTITLLTFVAKWNLPAVLIFGEVKPLEIFVNLLNRIFARGAPSPKSAYFQISKHQ